MQYTVRGEKFYNPKRISAIIAQLLLSTAQQQAANGMKCAYTIFSVLCFQRSVLLDRSDKDELFVL